MEFQEPTPGDQPINRSNEQSADESINSSARQSTEGKLASMNKPAAKNKASVDKAERLAGLIKNFRSRTITVEEHAELSAWINESEENEKLFEKLIRRTREEVLQNEFDERYESESKNITARNRRLVRILFAVTLVLFLAVLIATWLLIRSYERKTAALSRPADLPQRVINR